MEFFEISLLSGAKKHPDFQVTVRHRFVTTNIKYEIIKSQMSSET
jgi:hypothetical protein